MKVFSILLALLFALPQFAGAAGAPYSAIIMDMAGHVLVKHEGKAKPADIGELLYPGDVVETSRGARVTISYVESGQEEQWPENSNFSIGKTQTERRGAGVIVSNKKVEVPDLEHGQAGAVTVRGIQRKPEGPAIDSPDKQKIQTPEQSPQK